MVEFFFSSRRRHTRWPRDWSSDVCSSDLTESKQEVEKEITKLKEQKEEYVAKGNDLEALEARVEEEINSNESRSENEQIVQTATTTETSTSNPVEPESQVTESTSSNETTSENSGESTSTRNDSNSTDATTTADKDTKKKEKSKPKAKLSSGSNGSAISAAHSQTGTRYTTAGKSPSSGFDCSGFVSWAYAQEGVNLPSYTGALASKGQSVPSLSQAKA